MITEECINCGACEPECPNTAIYEGAAEWEYEGAKHPAIATDI
jgi:ferredoxin